jgi:uncharacterized OB-fold protein
MSEVITASGAWNKPLPSIDHDNAPFWEGLKAHQLLLWRCTRCKAWYWPVCYCRNCDNDPYAGQMRWEPASGLGKVFAFNVHHIAFHPGFKDEIPYVYALIELDEGPLISSTLVGTALPKDIYDIGQKVEIVYEDHPAEGFTLPRFRILE